MALIKDIYNFLTDFAPLELQMSFDNSGFLVGRKENEVSKVLLALDITLPVIEEAEKLGAQLIVSHHPLIFHPLKSITDDKFLSIVRSDISAICMHTNLDICDGGVNDVLIETLTGNKAMLKLGDDNCGRVAELEKGMKLSDFLALCKEKLDCAGIRFYDADRVVKRVACVGGAGADYMELAFEAGCDTFVSADIKYHEFQRAAELGINLIDADHFCTENPVIPVLHKKLSAAFPNVSFSVSQQHGQIISFY